MAIYHLSVKPVSRSSGRSATASAAYRAGKKGEPILDARTGQLHDYRRKGGVESADIVLPDGAPVWASDRAALWNAAELAEKRKDACVAREYEVALPAELSPEERRRLAVDFAQAMANREGCAVDVCIHAPGRGGDGRNHHAHLLRTTRKVEAEGLGDKLDTEKAGRNRKDDLEAVRAGWAELVNERLHQHGIQSQVDHRSLEAQGVDREPTRHMGPAVTGMERRGKPSEVGQRMAEEANARLSAARELGRIERELDRSLFDLTGDLAGAIREREERQREAERQPLDALAGFRASVERAEAAGGLAMDVAKAQLAVAQAFQADGKDPRHHTAAIMQEGQQRVFTGLQEQFQAKAEPERPGPAVLASTNQERCLEAQQGQEKRHPLQRDGETLEQTGWRLRAAFIKAERDAWREEQAAREQKAGETHAARLAELQRKRPWFGRDEWAQDVAEARRLVSLYERRAKEALEGTGETYGDESQWIRAADKRLSREYPEIRQAMNEAAARKEAEQAAEMRERQAAQRNRPQGLPGPRR